MPLITVYVRTGNTDEFTSEIAAGVQRAMIDVLGLPDDDYFQVTHELAPADMRYDPNFFGVARGPNAVMIELAFNARPAEVKQRLFEQVADNLERSPGVARADLFMSIDERDPANWWAFARTVDPETGTDSRMSSN